MREKFNAPTVPEYKEELFCRIMESSRSADRDELVSYLLVSDRELRKYKEKYNNNKYIGIVPKGKIICIKGVYELVTPESKLAERVIMKANFDLICSYINKKNTNKYVGELQAKGQLSFYDIQRKSYNELVELGQRYEELLNERD